MPWKECNAMDERVTFIVRFLAGEKVARLADEFGISRKTADKINERYQDVGVRWRCRRTAAGPEECAFPSETGLPSRAPAHP